MIRDKYIILFTCIRYLLMSYVKNKQFEISLVILPTRIFQ